MMNQPQGQTPEDASQASGGAPTTGDEAETFDVPATAIGGAKEGDTVMCKVISVNADSGTATLTVAQGEPEPTGGTDGMADEFQSPGASSAANSQPS